MMFKQVLSILGAPESNHNISFYPSHDEIMAECSVCGNNTWVDKRGYEHWNHDNGLLICQNCYKDVLWKRWNEGLPKKKCECSPECTTMIEAVTKGGDPARFAWGHNKRVNPHPVFWHEGLIMTEAGYVLRRAEGHPRANNAGYVFEHILVMEEYLGRLLIRPETVHHKNGIVSDNRIENLQLFSDNGAHKTHGHTVKAKWKWLFGNVEN